MKKFCMNCGSQNEYKNKTCSNCGEELGINITKSNTAAKSKVKKIDISLTEDELIELEESFASDISFNHGKLINLIKK